MLNTKFHGAKIGKKSANEKERDENRQDAVSISEKLLPLRLSIE
jgi:hypothetical protein